MEKLIKLSDVEEMIKDNIDIFINKGDGFSYKTEIGEGYILGLKSILSSLGSLPIQNVVDKNLALDFADWYNNGLLNTERKSVEEEFKKFIIVKYPTN